MRNKKIILMLFFAVILASSAYASSLGSALVNVFGASSPAGETGLPLYDNFAGFVDFAVFFIIFLAFTYIGFTKFHKEGNAPKALAVVLALALAIAAIKAGLSVGFLIPFVKMFAFLILFLIIYLLLASEALLGKHKFWAFVIAVVLTLLAYFLVGGAVGAVAGGEGFSVGGFGASGINFFNDYAVGGDVCKSYVLFEFDKPDYDDREVQEDRLTSFANCVRKNVRTVYIYGYASSDGEIKHNKVLAEDRAMKVKKDLETVLSGLKISIYAEGIGETSQFGSSYETNRRVVLRTSEEGETSTIKESCKTLKEEIDKLISEAEEFAEKAKTATDPRIAGINAKASMEKYDEAIEKAKDFDKKCPST